MKILTLDEVISAVVVNLEENQALYVNDVQNWKMVINALIQCNIMNNITDSSTVSEEYMFKVLNRWLDVFINYQGKYIMYSKNSPIHICWCTSRYTTSKGIKIVEFKNILDLYTQIYNTNDIYEDVYQNIL